jgi:hypothetical protein
MGARYGLPVCGALASRLRCAVLGKFGLAQTDRLPRDLAANDVITAAAGSIRAPILKHVRWHAAPTRRRRLASGFSTDTAPGPADGVIRAAGRA